MGICNNFNKYTIIIPFHYKKNNTNHLYVFLTLYLHPTKHRHIFNYEIYILDSYHSIFLFIYF
ncbi:MAG: hypothetical protein K6G15_06150 [Desulfovibrio sp.]|nr:hypothetical protein [Desulfovibrio sp.]